MKLKNNLAEKILKSGAIKLDVSAEEIIAKVPRPPNKDVYTGGEQPT